MNRRGRDTFLLASLPILALFGGATRGANALGITQAGPYPLMQSIYRLGAPAVTFYAPDL